LEICNCKNTLLAITVFFISVGLGVFGRNESWDTLCKRTRIFNLEHLHGSVFLACHMNGYIGTRERSPYGGGDDGGTRERGPYDCGDDGFQFFPVCAYCCMHL